MKLLLDECGTVDLRKDLAEHEVRTVVEAGYKGLKKLLRAAAGQYDVLITVDRNLPFQQNIRSLPIAILIIDAGGITYSHLKPLLLKVHNALINIQSGQIITIQKAGSK
jgi:predicted nuclease of predicted toxin-antitoxin system